MNEVTVWNIIQIKGNPCQIDFLRREMLPEVNKVYTSCDLDLRPYLEIPREFSMDESYKYYNWCRKTWGFKDWRYASFDDFDLLVIVTVDGSAMKLIQKISESHPDLEFKMEFNLGRDFDLRKEVVIQAGKTIDSKEFSFKKYNSFLNRIIGGLKVAASYLSSKNQTNEKQI